MTEYWVSQGKHWCEVCRCWMADTPMSIANHERGTGHKINVQKKLREMRMNAQKEKQEEERTAQELKKIEKAAAKAYKKDVDLLGQATYDDSNVTRPRLPGLQVPDEEAAPLPPPTTPPPQFGQWVPKEGTPHLYNAHLRYYYDKATGFYYGGDPPAWSQQPNIPEGAKYEKLHDAGKNKIVIRGTVPGDVSALGGHQAPISGTVTRGVVSDVAAKSRKRPLLASGPGSTSNEKVSDTERAEQEQREAARKRVQQRTAASFGLA